MNAKILTIAFAFVAFMLVVAPVSAQTPPPDAAPAAAAPADAGAAGVTPPATTVAAAVAPTQGELVVESTPPGADIEVDGNFVGNTPS